MKESVIRLTAAALCVAMLGGFAASAARADPPPWANGHHKNPYSNDAGPAHDRGVVSGTIAGVDYGRGTILVATPHGRVAIVVLPTTSIFRGPKDYATLSDLAVGTRVQVSVSEISGQLIAQIIRIK